MQLEMIMMKSWSLQSAGAPNLPKVKRQAGARIVSQPANKSKISRKTVFELCQTNLHHLCPAHLVRRAPAKPLSFTSLGF